MTPELTGPESALRSELEDRIHRGQAAFIDVGLALAEIRELQLYRASHQTFDNYCKKRWGWTRLHARSVIAAAAAAVGDVTDR